MRIIQIKKGKDIPLAGAAEKRLEDVGCPRTAAVLPGDFHGLSPRLLVKEGDDVWIGTPVLEDKQDPRLRIASPVKGRVSEIRRGEKRVLSAVVIEADDDQDGVCHCGFSAEEISGLSRQEMIGHLLKTGAWAFIRQRPFDRIADPDRTPKAVFVRALDTHPLALDMEYALEGQEKNFQAGLDVIARLTDGPVFLCVSGRASSPALIKARGVRVCAFQGPHPSGNVATHIAALSPITSREECVWYLDVQDTAAVGKAFLTGRYSAERVAAVTGERAQSRVYRRTVRGAVLQAVTGQNEQEGTRVISGNVLTGREAGINGFLGFYDSQVSLIPAGGQREFLGWMMPGWRKYSLSRTFMSSLVRRDVARLDSDMHGSARAIVLNHLYDRYIALDVMTFFLIRAVLAGEVEEMERLGILECSAEDFALASFVCPSKTDVCGIIQKGLDLIESEG